VDKDELTKWALGQWLANDRGPPEPSAPNEAIVRMVLKATVVNVEIKARWQVAEDHQRELQ